MTDNQVGADLSRRSVVKTTVAAAAAGGVLALAGPAAFAQAAEPAGDGKHIPVARTPESRAAGTGVLVRVLDANAGTLEIYTAAGHHTVSDRALATQLTRLAH
jgi:hypothetical protein